MRWTCDSAPVWARCSRATVALATGRCRRGVDGTAQRTRSGDADLPVFSRRSRLARHAISGAARAHALSSGRRTSVVSVPGAWVRAARGAWPGCTCAAAFSPAGSASNWRTRVRGTMPMAERGGRTDCGPAWGGRRASSMTRVVNRNGCAGALSRGWSRNTTRWHSGRWQEY